MVRGFILLAFLSFFTVSSWSGEKERVVALVERAAKAIQKDPGGTIAKINMPKNAEFKDGDLYMFVYDMEGVLLAIGFTEGAPKIGKNRLESKDSEGRQVVKELRDIALKKGKGWLEYKFTNPLNKLAEKKISYVMRVDLEPYQSQALGVKSRSLWIGSGTYKGSK